MASAAFAADAVENQGGGDRFVEDRIAARAGAFVHLKIPAGSLRVEGWDRDEVAVEGALGAGVRELRFETDGQRVWLEAHLHGAPGQQEQGEVKLRVMVPARSRLEVRTVDAAMVLRNLRGRLDLESITGNLRVEESTPDEIFARTVSGDMEFATRALRLEASSVSGAVRIEQEVEDLTVRTADGAVELLARVVREARLESVSGRIHVAAPVAAEGRLRVFVHDGLVDLELPQDLNASFHLETVRGLLESEFGPAMPESSGDRRLASQFRTGSGSARVEARSISGTLRLKSLDF